VQKGGLVVRVTSVELATSSERGAVWLAVAAFLPARLVSGWDWRGGVKDLYLHSRHRLPSSVLVSGRLNAVISVPSCEIGRHLGGAGIPV